MIRFPDEAFDYTETRFQDFYNGISYAMNWLKGRTTKIKVVPWINDVLEEFVEYGVADKEVENIVNTTIIGDYDTLAIKCLRFVQKRTKYVSDDKVWNVGEYWQTALETWERKTGDCEDGAILCYCLCRMCGIPANRLLVFASTVKGGGHAYLGYKPSYNPIVLVHLDWCYWYDSATCINRKHYFIKNKKITSNGVQDELYKEMWFAFNENKAFSHLNHK